MDHSVNDPKEYPEIKSVGANSEGVVSTVPIIPIYGIEKLGVVTLRDGSRNSLTLPRAFRPTMNKNVSSSARPHAIGAEKTHLFLITPRRTLYVVRLTVDCLHFNDGFAVPTLGDIVRCTLRQFVEGYIKLLPCTLVFWNNFSKKGPSILLK